MQVHKCATCPLWEKDTTAKVGAIQLNKDGKAPVYGVCHLNPPLTMLIGGQISSAQSITMAETWCSHHPKNKPDSP